MEKTRSQIEELDPLEGSVNRRDIFKKNLQSLESLEAKPSGEMESDEDSGYDVRSNSTSGKLISVSGAVWHQKHLTIHWQGAGPWRITRRGWS